MTDAIVIPVTTTAPSNDDKDKPLSFGQRVYATFHILLNTPTKRFSRSPGWHTLLGVASITSLGLSIHYLVQWLITDSLSTLTLIWGIMGIVLFTLWLVSLTTPSVHGIFKNKNKTTSATVTSAEMTIRNENCSDDDNDEDNDKMEKGGGRQSKKTILSSPLPPPPATTPTTKTVTFAPTIATPVSTPLPMTAISTSGYPTTTANHRPSTSITQTFDSSFSSSNKKPTTTSRPIGR